MVMPASPPLLILFLAIIFMVWLELGVVSALAVCNTTLCAAVYSDYRIEKASGKVNTFGEYFFGKY